MSETEQLKGGSHREDDAVLVLELAEAILLGYPALVVIGEIPGDQRNEVLANSYFSGLEQQKRKDMIEKAIAELVSSI